MYRVKIDFQEVFESNYLIIKYCYSYCIEIVVKLMNFNSNLVVISCKSSSYIMQHSKSRRWEEYLLFGVKYIN